MKIFLLLMLSLSLWANIGNIMAIKGSANVERGGSSLQASNGMELEKGDTIVTMKKSRVQIMLNDETVVTVGASSEFSFEEYFYDESKNSKLTMRANRGFFRSVTGEIGKVAPERFKVKTASATIGIRGTDFSGEIYEDREIFKCYQGKIYIEFEGDSREVSAGMMAEILKNRVQLKEINKGELIKKKSDLKLLTIDAIGDTIIPTEVITDITQIVEDENNEAVAEESDDVDTLNDPNIATEDRQTEY